MKKKFYGAIILSLTILLLIPLSANAAASGTCGKSLTWLFDGNGTLTISGTGNMYSFEDDDPEWYNFKSDIKEIVVNSGVTSIGDFAFNNCKNLTKLSLPKGIKSIGDAAFMYCEKLTDLTLPTTVEYIRDSAFSDCNITEITLPDSLKSIGENAFCGCGFTEIKIPDGVSIDAYAFGIYNSTLKKIDIGKNCDILNYAFYSARNLTDVTIGEGLTHIGNYAFFDCKGLTDITLPNSLKYIYPWAFQNCTNLKSINLPDNLLSIGVSAFRSCSSLTDVSCNMRNMTWDKIEAKIRIEGYNSCLTNASLHCPITSLNVEKINNIFLVTPNNVYNNEYIIFACYNDGKLVYINQYAYAGEKTIPFTTSEKYDKVKIMAWENSKNYTPLCKSKEF